MENFDPNKTPKKQILSAQIDLSKFERATDEEKRQQDVMSESTSFFKDGMRKLFKNPLAVLSIVVLAAIILTIIIAPMIVPYGYEEILSVNGKRDKGAKNLAPFTYSKAEQKYIDEGVVQSFTFGPLLVNDGEAVELPEKYIISTKDTIREPRTAIGQVDANHYVLVVADGRRDGWSDKGMTLQELQQVFVEQGCKVAYNLDGGGSATMILGSQRVNKTSGSRERDVSDIVYFTK